MSKNVLDLAYEQVADEVARNDLKPGLVARVTAEALGDEKKGRALYLKYRAEQLCVEIEQRITRQQAEKKQAQLRTELERNRQEQNIRTMKRQQQVDEAVKSIKIIALWIFCGFLILVVIGYFLAIVSGA